MNFNQFLKFDEKFYDNVPVNGLADFWGHRSVRSHSNISSKAPHSIKLPSPTHYFPGGKKYYPRINRPEGTPVYSREGD